MSNRARWERRVAVIGAGPAGLAATRYLLSHGFDPVVYERTGSPGGQWSGHPTLSGVWPTLRTNTSRVLTALSDLPLPNDLAVYPTNQQIHAYLTRYSEQFGVAERIAFDQKVVEVTRGPRGWIVRRPGVEEEFARVVVATGRFHAPFVPDVPGLALFTGSEGVSHTYAYKAPERYRGKRVLVAGCAVSALEIASDLAMLGAQVVVTQRRQRYVLPKIAAGVPSDHRVFTRALALAEEHLPREEVGRMIRNLVVSSNGSPEQYGAPRPADDVFAAGLTLSQYYLSLVAEGRITIRPWMRAVDGETVHFAEGQAEPFDAIVLGTGFTIDLPFLGDDVRRVLAPGAQCLPLYKHTFHPDLPGFAFLGQWDQAGPYLPPIELQARWVAYSWSGACPAPTTEEMAEAIAAGHARRHESQKTRMHLVATTFARAAGVEPQLERWPSLARALLFGPLSPASFRLEGPDALPDAPARVAADAREFGCFPDGPWTPAERALAERVGAGAVVGA